MRSAGETEPRGSRWVGQSPMELRGERPRRGNEGENTPRQPLGGCPEGTMATSPPYDPISSHMSALRVLDRVLAPSSPQRHLRRRSARPECFRDPPPSPDFRRGEMGLMICVEQTCVCVVCVCVYV